MFFLLRYYISLLLVFLVGRLAFVLTCMPDDVTLGIVDYLQMETHGLLLDTVVAGYFIVLPLLLTIAAVWMKNGLRMRRFLTAYTLMVSVVIAAVHVADSALYPFWHFKLDASVFLYLDSPQNAVASVSPAFVAMRVVVFAVWATLVFLLLHRQTPLLLRYEGKRILRTAVLLLLCVPLAISIRGGLGESTANIGRVYYSDVEFCNHVSVNPVFSLLYSLGKTSDYAAQYDFYPEEERAERFSGLFSTLSADTPELLTNNRPNVLLIILEGFGGQFVEAIGGRHDIAPNLNHLSQEGIYFTRCYSSSFRTDRGTLATLSGYPAFPDLSVMKMPMKSRTLPCLPRSLNKAGYRSAFLYGGDINFTNMQSYLRTGGYSDVISDKDFAGKNVRNGEWGVDDEATFLHLRQMIAERRKGNGGESNAKPWHIAFLTLSSHEPWDVPEERLKDEVENAFAFTDNCLGNFITWFKQQPEWRNTLVVLIPDHGVRHPATISHERHYRNEMLWLGGVVKEPAVVSTIMSQCDLPATLLAQLSLPHDDYTFSRDIFSRDYQQREFAYFTLAGGMAFVDATGHSVFDLNAKRIIENEDYNHVDGENASTDGANARADGENASTRIAKAKAIIQTLYDDLGSR